MRPYRSALCQRIVPPVNMARCYLILVVICALIAVSLAPPPGGGREGGNGRGEARPSGNGGNGNGGQGENRGHGPEGRENEGRGNDNRGNGQQNSLHGNGNGQQGENRGGQHGNGPEGRGNGQQGEDRGNGRDGQHGNLEGGNGRDGQNHATGHGGREGGDGRQSQNQNHGNGRQVDGRPHLGDNAVKQMKNTWASCQGQGKCQENRNRQVKTRNAVKESIMRGGQGGRRKGLDDATVERRFQKAYQIKKTMLQLQGLSEVEPHDNGLIGGDMLFSEQHLDRISSSLKGVINPAAVGDVPLVDEDQIQFIPLTGTSNRQKRADVLALDFFDGNKWPTNLVNFHIDPTNFTQDEGDIIRNALKSISSQVSCLEFRERMTDPFIDYVKAPSDTDEGTCGWSDVGYQSDGNTVTINYASSICKKALQGVVVHETLHALGFVHEHTRFDRDKYMKIDWSNVDPQSMDVFTKDDPHDYNPYCIPFDPLSIMHYDPYVGALDSNKPVMTPLYFSNFYLPRMGQGLVMAATDATLLDKMYCKTPQCKDKSVNCGWTACGNCSTWASVCAKSCGTC